jgi:hypothetical protein
MWQVGGEIDVTSNDLMGQLPSEIRVLPQLGTILHCVIGLLRCCSLVVLRLFPQRTH